MQIPAVLGIGFLGLYCSTLYPNKLGMIGSFHEGAHSCKGIPAHTVSQYLPRAFPPGGAIGKCLCIDLKLLGVLESGGLGLDIELMWCEH